MRIGIFLIVLPGLMTASQLSFAAPQDKEEDSVGPESDEQELENIDLENLDRAQLGIELRRSKVRLGWGVALTSLGTVMILSAAAVIVSTAVKPAAPNGPLGEGIFSVVAISNGLILLAIGIPLWGGSHRRKKSILEKLDHMPSVSFAAGGVYESRILMLTWRF